MSTERETDGFIIGRMYQFNPPITTNCVFLSGAISPPKEFYGGECIGFEEARGVYIFQGKPTGETSDFIFFVRWGEGSMAHSVQPPKLRVIQGGKT